MAFIISRNKDKYTTAIKIMSTVQDFRLEGKLSNWRSVAPVPSAGLLNISLGHIAHARNPSQDDKVQASAPVFPNQVSPNITER